MGALIMGVDHPAIAASDADKLAEWYMNILGYEKVVRTETGTWLLKSGDGVFLEIMREDGTPRPERTVFSPGMSHLALRVKNYAEAEAALEKAGVKWTNTQGQAVGGGVLRNFLDPEGNVLQIVARS